jgi:hypothetical protein
VGYTGMWADKVRAMTLFYYPSEFLYGKYTFRYCSRVQTPTLRAGDQMQHYYGVHWLI